MAGNRAVFETAVKRAHSYAWEERWMKAIEQYELAVAEFPDDSTARSGLAFSYYKAKRLREALREYRKLCESRLDDPSPRTKMAQILEEMGRPSDAAQALLGLAELYVQQEDMQRAIGAWENAARLQPVNKEAHQKLAEAHSCESNPKEAAKEYLALARLCHEEGERKDAALFCQQALSLDGGSRGARALLERLASEGDAIGETPALVMGKEELGPVDEAVKLSLSTLAEVLLGDGRLVDPSEVVARNGSDEAALDAPSDLGTVLGKAIDLHSRGMREDALGYYEEALNRGVGRTEVVFSVGLLKKELSHFDEAVRYLQRAIDVPEYGLACRLILGQCYWAQGRAEEALDHFIEALKIIDLESAGPERADDLSRAYQSLSVSRWGLGEGRGSELVVHSLMELLRGSEWRDKIRKARHKLGSLVGDGVAPILPEVLDVPGGEEVVDIMVSSRQHLKRGMPFTALEECYRAIRLAPTYLPLHLRLAEIFGQQGKSEEAVDKYTAVADAYLMRDDPRTAMEVYRRALVAAPMSITIREKLIDLLVAHDELESALDEYVALGESYYRLARVDTALQKYEAALDLAKRTGAPTDWKVGVLHRVADLHMQRVHWKEAVAIYEQILEVSPDDEQARFHLVELHYALGQEDRALRDVDALIARYGKRKEFSRIATMLKELVASNPQDISLRSRLSRFYAELGMKKEAIAELDTLGELQLEAGRRRDAMETLRTILTLEPDEKEGYTQLLWELEDSTHTA